MVGTAFQPASYVLRPAASRDSGPRASVLNQPFRCHPVGSRPRSRCTGFLGPSREAQPRSTARPSIAGTRIRRFPAWSSSSCRGRRGAPPEWRLCRLASLGSRHPTGGSARFVGQLPGHGGRPRAPPARGRTRSACSSKTAPARVTRHTSCAAPRPWRWRVLRRGRTPDVSRKRRFCIGWSSSTSASFWRRSRQAIEGGDCQRS